MHPSSGSSVARAKPSTAEMDPIRVERTRALHRRNDAMATPSRPVAEGSTKPVNPSFAKPSSESTSCDNAPLRVPRRRPSADEESTLHSASLLSDDDDDDDDDATQVTSNTNPHLHVEEHPTTTTSSSEEKDGEEKDEHHTVATCHLTDQGSATSKQTETDLVVFGHANNERTAPTCPQRRDEEEEEVHVESPVILVSNPTSPPDITCTNTNIPQEEEEDPKQIPLLTKERIRSFITDYYEDFDSIFQKNGSNKQLQKECFEAFFDQYYTEDVMWIRSSGNPIGRKDLAGMLTDNIDVEHALLVSIDHICLLAGGQVATVVYTADLLFSFQGKPQSDRTVLSSVVQLDGVEPKIAHVHWSAGQPIPKASRWET